MTTFRAALTLLVCATAIAAGAQEPSYAVLFRVTDSKLRPEPSSTTNCVIVENGSYRLEVKNGTGKAEKRNTSIFLGKLPDQVSERLRVLIAAPELVALGDVKMSKEPQAFTDALQIVGLRVRRESTVQQVSYMNGDGTQSIPAPVKAFIPWLKSLLKDNRPIKDTDPNSCQSLDPAGNTKP
jgi:hypothetical protein